MTLDELAAGAPRAAPAPVPAWAWGCFRRRSITYAAGREDDSSQAVRLQAQGMAGYLCLPGGRPDVSGRDGLHDCSVDELLALTAVDGGVADAAWSGDAMTTDNPSAFQPHPTWPQPGLRQRVGPALIEASPSGAYLEDWRLQPGSAGLLVGLRLMFETGLDGLTRPRDGGLVICGQHALFTLDRRRSLPSDAPLQQQMRQAGDPYAFADMAFDAETSYGLRQADGSFQAALSTHPFRDGQPLPITGGFVQTSISEVLRQEVPGPDGRIVRQWRIDTLIADAEIVAATPTAEWAVAEREGDSRRRGL